MYFYFIWFLSIHLYNWYVKLFFAKKDAVSANWVFTFFAPCVTIKAFGQEFRRKEKPMTCNYKTTMRACFAGYVVQAIINNFAPLLFVTWQGSFALPLGRITLLITVNFLTQLAVDLFGALFVDRIGYRVCVVAAHVFSAVGLASLAFLPYILPPYAGIMIAVVISAVGSGLIEVLVSPIMEACPTPNKESAMSLLHSFYCWGQAGVVLLSTVFFALAGREHWRWLALVWAALPFANAFVFLRTPLPRLLAEGDRGMSLKEFFSNKYVIIFTLMMFAAGAGELAVSQWASAFAETGLGVSKTAGDLAGPMLFAVLMGGARLFYGKRGSKLPLEKAMLVSGCLCVFSYLLASLSPWPLLSLAGCALTGLGVGVMWPGTFSLASKRLPRGGTAMFALLALSGDLGCAAGPTLIGRIAVASPGGMRTGLLVGAAIPAVLVAAVLAQRKR